MATAELNKISKAVLNKNKDNLALCKVLPLSLLIFLRNEFCRTQT